MRNLVLFLGLFLLVACKQSNKSIGDAVLIPIHTQIPLYQKINGSIIDYTMNDTIREVYPFIGIYKIKGDLFWKNIVISYDLMFSSKEVLFLSFCLFKLS